jgi:indoleacetamide hydrolase
LFDAVITGDMAPLARIELKGIRIGVTDFFFTNLDSEVERVANAALDRLRAARVTIVRADLPDAVKTAPDAALTIIASEFRPSIETFLRTEHTGVSFEDLIAQVGSDLKPLFAEVPPPRNDDDAMVAQRARMGEAIKAHFAEHRIEALAFPPAMIPPHKIGENGSVTIQGRLVPETTTMGRNVSLGSCASLASLVLPAGLTNAGLPVGLEFDALPGSDRRLLALGAALQTALGGIAAPTV